jgi:subtilisin family serine protease
VKKITIVIVSFSMFIVLVAFQNCGKVASSQLDAASMDKLSFPAEKADRQMIVRMMDDQSHAELVSWAESHGMVNMNANDPQALNTWNANQMSVWQWDAPFTTEEMMAELSASGLASSMAYAEPNYIYQADTTPKEITNLLLSEQILTLGNPTSDYNNKLVTLRSTLSPLLQLSQRQIVAVIDSGVDVTHLAFKGADAIWYNPGEVGLDANGNDKSTNGIDDDGNGYIDDVNGYNFKDKSNNLTDETGHGTHCAGIVLASNRNIFDTSLNPTKDLSKMSRLLIMPLKFIGPNGGATSDAINAIFYASDNGAKVLSNSWGGPTYSRALEDAIAYSYDHDAVFVAAAGNSSSNNDNVAVYPANYKLPNVISVAALNTQETGLATYSNYGNTSVDLAAPGTYIMSTYPRPAGELTSDFYAYLSGTSMATPMVSGIAALSLFENRYLKAHQVKQVLVDSLKINPALDGKLITSGVVDPTAAIDLAKLTTPATSKPVVPSRSLASTSQADSSSGGGGGGCGLVAATGGNFPPSSGGPNGPLVALLFLPLAIALGLRQRQTIYS